MAIAVGIAQVVYVASLAVLGVYGLHRLFLALAAARRGGEEQPPRVDLGGDLPAVTVQIPLYNERHVAARAIDAAAALAWPKDRLEIQILDDSTDDTAAICAARAAAHQARGIDVAHIRRATRDGFKAGALAHGLSRCRGELILVLDADFVVPADFLARTVGHFRDPDIGMVQARWEHLNRNASLLTEVQGVILDGHFAVEQHARHRLGRGFNFNGTAGLWRRQAIADAGGWHADTLTEDLDLSYRALLAGWRFAYAGEVSAPAELPADINAFKSQQFRWAKGSVEVARKLLWQVLRSRLHWRVKLEAALHLTQNIPYLVTLMLIACAIPALLFSETGAPAAWDVGLAVATTGTFGFYAGVSQRSLGRRGGFWRAMFVLPAVIAVMAGMAVAQARAVWLGLIGHASPFIRTPKCGDANRGRRYRAKTSKTAALEILLALSFAVATAWAMTIGRPACVPIFALFAFGFAYVGLLSIHADRGGS